MQSTGSSKSEHLPLASALPRSRHSFERLPQDPYPIIWDSDSVLPLRDPESLHGDPGSLSVAVRQLQSIAVVGLQVISRSTLELRNVWERWLGWL